MPSRWKKAAIKALSALRNPHAVGTDKHRLWRQGVADIMRSAVASWGREQDRTTEKELERSGAEADTDLLSVENAEQGDVGAGGAAASISRISRGSAAALNPWLTVPG